MTQEPGDGAAGGPTSVERAGGGAALDAVAAAVGAGVFRLDADGRIETVSDAVVDAVGGGRDDLIGELFTAVVAESDVEAVERTIRSLRDGFDEGNGDRQVGEVATSIRTASGDRVPCELRIAAVGADGQFGGAAGVLRVAAGDERPKTADRDRPAREVELDDALDRVSDAFFAVDASGRFTYVNERAGELLERDPEALVGADVVDELHGTEETPFVEEALRSLETGEQVTFEAFYPPVSRWFRVRLYPGETGVSVYFRDVTEELRRESALEQYETVVEAVDDGLYAVDEDYRFTLVNDAYCRLTGYDREELLGEHVSMVVDESTVEEATALREALRREDGDRPSGTVEVEIERADGERVPVESRYVLLRDEEAFRGTVGVVRDVSERKAFEETLTTLHEASRELHAAETDDDVDRAVMETVTGVLDLTAATLFRYDEAAHEMVPERRTAGAVDTDQELPRLPVEDSLTGHVLEVGEFRAYDDVRETAYVDDPVTGMRAGLFAPIGDDRILVVSATEPGAFDERDERLVEILAENATTAIERHGRERELRESERRYRLLVDNFPNGAVALYDEGCHYVAVGGQMYDRLDLSPDDAVGKTVGGRLSGEIAETLESLIGRAFEGESAKAEAPYDGRDFRLQALPIRDEDGDVTLAMVVTQDVTERKAAQEALEESERRFRTVMEQSPLSTQIFDPDGNAVMVNPAWEELWGTDSEALGDYNVLEDEQLAEKGIRSALERAFEGEATQLPAVHYDPAEIGKEGRPRWVEAFAYPVVDEAGEIREVVLIHNDVTESRERARELERYEQIVETVDDGVYVLDGDGQFVLVNESFAELTGHDREELIGADVTTVTTGEYSEAIEEEVRRLEEGEASVGTVETAILTAEGERVPVEARFSLFQLEEGTHGRVGTVRDVSERKERERALEQSERRYRTLAENIPNGGVGVFDDELRFSLVEGQILGELEGLSAEELAGTTLEEALPEDNVADLEPAFRAALQGESSHLETTFEGVVFEVWVTPLRDEDGEVYAGSILAMDVTDRVERERELAEQRERYQGLVESAPVAIATYDADGSLTYVNDAGAALVGADAPEDVVGRSAIEFIHPDDRAEAAERMRRVVEDREPAPPRETKLVDLDGDVKYAILASAPVTAGGEPGGQVVLSDVTERKEYERRLEESEQRYRTLVESYPDGAVAMFDSDLRYTAVGGQLLEAEGVDPEERIGESIFDLYPEDLLEEIEPHFHAALEGETNSFEVRYRGRDLFNDTLPVRNADGEVFGGMLVVNDVTEQREYERTLERFRTMIETVDDGVYTIDAEGYITMANAAYAEMVGYHREDLIGMHASELVDESVHERARELEAELAEDSTTTARLTADLLTADGSTVTAEATFALLPGDDEDYERVAVVRDITERVEREAELERALDLLHHTEEVADVGGWELDPETMEVFWTEELFDILGVPYEEEPPLTEALDAVYHEEDRTIVEEAIEAALEDGEPFDVEARFVSRGGDEPRWARIQGIPTVEDGEVVSLRGAFQDITERVERERELEQFEVLFKESTDVNAVLDEDGTFQYVTPSAEHVLGYEQEALVGESVFEFIHPDDREAVVEEFATVVEDPDYLGAAEFRFRHADGSWVVLEGRGRNFLEEPVIGGVVAYTRDVTELKERERELRERVEQEDVVTELGTLALEEPDLDRLFDRATDLVAETLDNDLCKLLELRPDGDTLALRGGYGWEEGLVGSTTLGTGDDSIAGRTLETEEAIVVDDLHAEDPADRPDLLTEHGGRSGVSVIVGTPRDPWGVLGTYDGDVKEFSQQDVNFVQSVANILGIAIERASREAELHRRVEQQQVVTDLGKRALSEVDLDRLFDEAVERVAETLDNEYAKVLELQPGGESLLLRAGVGWREGLVGEGTVGTGDDSQADHTIRSEEPIVVTDLATEERFSGPELLTSHGVVSGISTIIGPFEDPWGVLGTHDTARREFSRQDVNFVQSVANILATAIDRRTREREIEDQRNRMAAVVRLSEIVQEVDQAVIRQSSREEIDRLVCEHLVESGEYGAAWIGDVNLSSERVAPRAVAGVPGELVEEQAFDSTVDGDQRGPTANAAASGEPGDARVGEDADDPEATTPFPTFARDRGYRSMAAVPLAFEDVRYGVLTLFSTREDAFEGYELTILEHLGRTVGHAINAIDRKQALVGDSFTELEIRLPDAMESLDLSGEPGGAEHTITVEGTVPAGGDKVVQYLTVSGLSPESFREAAGGMAAVEEIRHIGDDGTRDRYEVTYSDPPISSTLASYGGRIEAIALDVPDLRVTVALPSSADVRQIVGSLRTEFPDVKIDAQRTVTREGPSAEEYRTAIEEGLTDRQRTALMAAFFAGYFEWSRESTGEEVAETLGVSPSTFHQHLRAAQRKVFSTLFENEQPV